MSNTLKFIAVLASFVALPAAGWANATLINYEDFDQEIALTTFRAGTHDSAGKNEYYLKVFILAEKATQGEEIVPPVIDSLGTFAELSLPPLAYWKKSKEDTTADSIEIAGDSLRRLTADAMSTFQITEDEIVKKAQIKVFEVESYFGLIGEDRLVHTFLYDPMKREPLELSFRDKFGAEIELKVTFATPIVKQTAAK